MTDTPVVAGNEVRNEIIVTMDGRDISIPLDSVGINLQNSDREILDAIRPVMQTREGFDMSDSRGEFSYSVRKAMNSNTIYVYPKPVAG